MCLLCDKYGDGGKYYLNPVNYARRLYKIRKIEASGPEANPQAAGEGMGGPNMSRIIATYGKDQQAYEEYKKQAEEIAINVHFGKIVTLEESLAILDIAYPIARMTCACRRTVRGQSNEDDFFCIGIGPGMYKWERWPETYRGGVEFLTPSQAKEWLRYLDKKGMVHMTSTFGTPYIGGMCQCSRPDCFGLRMMLEYGVKNGFKGEYVATLEDDKCNGCALCVKRCQFGAMRMAVSSNRVFIDANQCYGCGLCATGCARDAIVMAERVKFPALATNW